MIKTLNIFSSQGSNFYPNLVYNYEAEEPEYEEDPISLDYDLLSGLGLSADSLGFGASAPRPPAGAQLPKKPEVPSGSFFARAPSKTAPSASRSARCSGPNGKSPKMPRQTEVN